MSNSSRAWLLQNPQSSRPSTIYCFTDSLKGTGYFNKIHSYIGKDLGWSNNIIYMLDFIEPVFFMGCEDHLLVDFNEELVENAYKAVEYKEFGCVRLTKKAKIPVVYSARPKIYAISESYKYYVSLQPSVWSKSYLEKIIRPNESAWQFEILASQRAKEIDPPAGVTYKTAFNYRNMIEKGKLVDKPKTYTEIHGE